MILLGSITKKPYSGEELCDGTLDPDWLYVGARGGWLHGDFAQFGFRVSEWGPDGV